MTSSIPANSLSDRVPAWPVQAIHPMLALPGREQPCGHTICDRLWRCSPRDRNFLSFTTEQTNQLCQHYNPQLTPPAITDPSFWHLLPRREGFWQRVTPSDLSI